MPLSVPSAIKIAAALIIGSAVWYFGFRSSAADHLDVALHQMGFFPLNPPSTLLTIGSLYHVDPDVKVFRTLCVADADDVPKARVKSRSTRTVANALYSNSYDAGLTAQNAGSGKVTDKYLGQVRYTLLDVQLYEIDLAANRRIRNSLMKLEDCNAEVLEIIHAPGYVCQGQSILEATVEYHLDVDGGQAAGLATGDDQVADTATANIQEQVIVEVVKEAVKTAVKAKSNIKLEKKSGKLVTGTSLNYGVAMNLTCFAPRGAYFARFLPRTFLDRMLNYMKFRVLERVLPARDEQPATSVFTPPSPAPVV